ncbi:MAG: signal peptidase II [Candidatus Margulisbacteria bacterium]|nr:signal peptidase II [Candidatus Margulisiibacteriota bacterium]MBU1617223.1 signal peptidase II [Candidatus Margulisiibacteriota bacterium]MBU1867280.1 signal peptidase II [Candidatus Margulisiibacteriota bacterium]
MFFYLLAASVCLADQAVKQLVHNTFQLGQSIPIIGPYLTLTYVRNTGAAFSILTGKSPFLSVIGLVAVALMIYFHYRLPANEKVAQTGLALMLGGSIGNLFDRFARHYVIDYIDLKVWPVFNLADIMINLGVALIILAILFQNKEE